MLTLILASVINQGEGIIDYELSSHAKLITQIKN
jgi:hypothetical protein